MDISISLKKNRKYNTEFRNKISQNINKLKNKESLITILNIIHKDSKSSLSQNKSGIYFNINILTDNSIEKIIEILKNESIENSDTASSTKLEYISYSDSNNDINNIKGGRLRNHEKIILKKVKNMKI